ncbi:MAG TPA: TIM barrel protein [Acidimicrobiales bacterium]
MGLGSGDLVLCSGTLPRDVSFADRLAAAAGAGFGAVSLWGRDYGRARRDGLSDADIRSMLADHGLAVAEIDPAWWWLPGAAEVGASIPPAHDEQNVFAYGEDELLRIAETVGARSLNAVDVFGGEWDVEQGAEALAALADRAAEHGLLVHLEFLPWSRVPDVATAWEIVRLADRPNAGVAVDSWHFAHSGSDDATLQKVPGDRVLGIQLSDGPSRIVGDPVAATLHARELPGTGELGVVSLVRTLDQIGAAAPIGVEVFSDELHGLGPAEAARRAAVATRAVLDAARP